MDRTGYFRSVRLSCRFKHGLQLQQLDVRHLCRFTSNASPNAAPVCFNISSRAKLEPSWLSLPTIPEGFLGVKIMDPFLVALKGEQRKPKESKGDPRDRKTARFHGSSDSRFRKPHTFRRRPSARSPPSAATVASSKSPSSVNPGLTEGETDVSPKYETARGGFPLFPLNRGGFPKWGGCSP